MKFKIIKYSGDRERHLTDVEAPTASDALKELYGQVDDGGTAAYATATLVWNGVGFCRERHIYVAAVAQ
jgi:hypothetical protein